MRQCAANGKRVGRDVNRSGGNRKHGAATGVIPGRSTRKWWGLTSGLTEVDRKGSYGSPGAYWVCIATEHNGRRCAYVQLGERCPEVAEQRVGDVLLGVRRLKSPDGFPGLKRDPETDRRFTRQIQVNISRKHEGSRCGGQVTSGTRVGM